MRATIGNKLKIKAAVASAAAAVIFISLWICYRGELGRFFEMTFLSNFTAGALLSFAAVSISITGRDVPHFLYLDAAALLLVVVAVCAVYAPGECFCGRSALLHLVDPAIMLCFYVSLCDPRGSGLMAALSALVFPALYFAFMIAYGRLTGGRIYAYFDPNTMSVTRLLASGFAASALVVAVSCALLYGGAFWRYRRDKRTGAGDNACK